MAILQFRHPSLLARLLSAWRDLFQATAHAHQLSPEQRARLDATRAKARERL